MRKININIATAELLKEVAKWGYTVGENLGDDMAKHRHFVQGPTDRGHVDLVKSAMDDAWAEILQMLAVYTYGEKCQCGCDDCHCSDLSGNDNYDTESDMDFDSDECAEYKVVLSFPDNTAPTLAANIGRLCRRYLLMRARAEWEVLTRQDPSYSNATAENAIRRLKVEITNRTTGLKMKKWNYGY